MDNEVGTCIPLAELGLTNLVQTEGKGKKPSVEGLHFQAESSRSSLTSITCSLYSERADSLASRRRKIAGRLMSDQSHCSRVWGKSGLRIALTAADGPSWYTHGCRMATWTTA